MLGSEWILGRAPSLDSRNKRLGLPIGELYLEQIRAGGYLLYRRPKNGSNGIWLVRWYDKDTRKQRQERLGSADDFAEADRLSVFTYEEALAKAEVWFKTRSRFAELAAGGEVIPEGPYSVADAFQDYFADAKRRGMKGFVIAQQTANAHILPELGPVPVAKLTRRRIEDWHLALAESARRKTGKFRDEAEHLAAPRTDEEKRKRKNSANRVLTILKAALNHALDANKVTEPAPWRSVRPFKGVNASRVRFLSVSEQRKLVEACEGDFKALVQAALFTGARYGELTRLRVQDFNPRSGTVFIEISKSGRSRHIYLTEEAKSISVNSIANPARSSHDFHGRARWERSRRGKYPMRFGKRPRL